MRSSFFALPLVLAAAACSGGDDDKPVVTADTPTFHRDVAPLMDQYCARCHDGKSLGPGNFKEYATASGMGSLMVTRIDAGDMPPPAADPDCHEYSGSDHLFMDPGARDVIAAWVAAGTPEGDPADAPTTTVAVPHLSSVDTTLTIAAPYTPDYDENNEYRCFILDWDDADGRFITGFEPIIDQASISHHTLLFEATNGMAESYVTDPATKSWKCEITPDEEWPTLHAWAPGNNPIEFPEGKGIRVNPGSQLVLQMHYYRSGPDADTLQDLPGYQLKTAEDVETELFHFPIGPDSFTIPAGAEAHEETLALSMFEFGIPVNTTIWGVFPHMHVLGAGYDFHATTPDGEEKCISRADRYDFSNQPTYSFPEPIVLSPVDELSIGCTWNNSASNPDRIVDPPQDTIFGERTDQEMCYALMYVSFGG